MSLKNTTIMAVVSLMMSLTACSKLGDTPQAPHNALDGYVADMAVAPNAKKLQVMDLNGSPIAGAQVLIGSALNQPFPSNFLTTDGTGSFAPPASWKSAQMVTISAPGYIRVTFLGQIPNGQKFEMRAAGNSVTYELKGKGTGFQVKNNDNLVDFALMMPIVKKQDLFAFDMNMFISPKTDVVTVMGQKLPLPSNVSVPKQTENYGILPVSVEKLQYRLYFDALGRQQVYTVRGQFPFRQVVNEFQNGKTFTEIINYISLKGGSLKEVNLTGTTQNFDLPVNEMVFDQSKVFTSSNFKNDEVLLAAPLYSMNGALMPTDLKNVPANTAMKLTTMAGESQLLLALKKKNESGGGRFSAVIVPFQEGVQPELLQMIDVPRVNDFSHVTATAPTRPSTVQPVATYSVLSTVGEYEEAGKKYEIVNRIWEVYANDWMTEVHLPEWPGGSAPEGAKRWEVTFVAAPTVNKGVALSPRILETVTHATHSAADF